MSPTCAGFLIFTKDLSSVLLVTNHNNVYSFPKGKIEKKKGEKDALIAAYRELKEETGVTSDQVTALDGVYVDEDSMKGQPGAIRLFLGFLNDENYQFQPEDKDEIRTAELVPIKNALEVLMEKRQKVLNLGLQLCFLKRKNNL